MTKVTRCVCGQSFTHDDDEELHVVIEWDPTGKPHEQMIVRDVPEPGGRWICHTHDGHELIRVRRVRRVVGEVTPGPSPDEADV